MFSVNTNHPIITPTNDYVLGRKNISIHSEDRDITKWPEANEFSIILPQALQSVQSIKLVDFSLPTSIPIFTLLNQNTSLTIEDLTTFNQITISEGSYSAEHLANELQFKINNSIDGEKFRVVYDMVENKFKFGNTSNSFKLHFDKDVNTQCQSNVWDNKNRWGLGWNLGFNKETAVAAETIDESAETYIGYKQTEILEKWITPPPPPGLAPAPVWVLSSPNCSNINGESTIYMELDRHNASDELYINNRESKTTANNTKCLSDSSSFGGVVNSYFAKIPTFGFRPDAFSNNLYQSIIDNNPSNGIQYYYKVEDRIEKLKFRFRYHDGTLVNFGNHPFNFSLLFTFLKHDESTNYNSIRVINI